MQHHQEMVNQARPFLSGWKEIANYMGLGVRTVQRYRQQLGLPVRRSAGKPRCLVIATKEELDAWVHARPLTPSFPLDASSLRVALRDFRIALAKQHQLREDLKKMREELHASVEMLHVNIRLQANMGEEFTSIPLRMENGLPRVN